MAERVDHSWGFDPRKAALKHAGFAERYAGNVRGDGRDQLHAAAELVAQGVHALACALVYIGDQVAGERPTTVVSGGFRVVLPNAEAVTAWRAMDEPEAEMSRSAGRNRGEGFHTAGGE